MSGSLISVPDALNQVSPSRYPVVGPSRASTYAACRRRCSMGSRCRRPAAGAGHLGCRRLGSSHHYAGSFKTCWFASKRSTRTPTLKMMSSNWACPSSRNAKSAHAGWVKYPSSSFSLKKSSRLDVGNFLHGVARVVHEVVALIQEVVRTHHVEGEVVGNRGVEVDEIVAVDRAPMCAGCGQTQTGCPVRQPYVT